MMKMGHRYNVKGSLQVFYVFHVGLKVASIAEKIYLAGYVNFL